MSSLFNYKVNGAFQSVPILSTSSILSRDITGDGATTTFEFTHNKNNYNVIVQMMDLDNYETVEATIVRSSENAVSVTFGEAPAVGKKYRIMVI